MAISYDQFKAGALSESDVTEFAAGSRYRSLKDPAGLGADWATREWQSKAWSLYDQLGEVHFSAEYFGNAVSQASLMAGELVDNKVRAVVSDNEIVNQVSAKILRQLTGEHHGLDQVLREIAVSLFVVGEVWLVEERLKSGDRVERDEDGKIRTFLKVVPSLDVRSKNGVDGYFDVSRKESDLDGFVPFSSSQARIRVYRPDARCPSRATSNLQGVIHAGKTLLMLDRLVRGTIKSRVHAGILKVPNEISFGANPGYKAVQGGDVLGQKMVEELAQPIEDEDSAGSVVPFILRGPAEYLTGVELLSLERDFDEYLPELMEKYTRRLAMGLDLPAEVLLGMGGANHWASWFLSAEFVRLHAKPFLNLLTGVLTKKLLHPALIAEGVEDVERFCFTFDELALVVQANKSQNAKDAKAMGLISDEAARHHLGFSESDAPSPDDVVAGSPAQRQPVDVENPVVSPIGEEE